MKYNKAVHSQERSNYARSINLCPDTLPHLGSPVATAHYTYLSVALHTTCEMTHPSFTQIVGLTNGEAPEVEMLEDSLAPL